MPSSLKNALFAARQSSEKEVLPKTGSRDTNAIIAGRGLPLQQGQYMTRISCQ